MELRLSFSDPSMWYLGIDLLRTDSRGDIDMYLNFDLFPHTKMVQEVELLITEAYDLRIAPSQ